MSAKIVNNPIQLRYRPNNNLIVISADVGNGMGDQTIMTLNPREAIALGNKLKEMGETHGGANQ
jgi:hypothetical protein